MAPILLTTERSIYRQASLPSSPKSFYIDSVSGSVDPPLRLLAHVQYRLPDLETLEEGRKDLAGSISSVAQARLRRSQCEAPEIANQGSSVIKLWGMQQAR